jgi:hypothetical protein
MSLKQPFIEEVVLAVLEMHGYARPSQSALDAITRGVWMVANDEEKVIDMLDGRIEWYERVYTKRGTRIQNEHRR